MRLYHHIFLEVRHSILVGFHGQPREKIKKIGSRVATDRFRRSHRDGCEKMLRCGIEKNILNFVLAHILTILMRLSL